MTAYVNDNGSWRTATAIYVNDGGTWRTVNTGYINESGTWRTFHTSGTAVTLTAAGQPGSSGAGGVNSITWGQVSPGTTFNIRFAGGDGPGGPYAAVYVGPVSPGNIILIAGGGGAFGSQSGGGGGPGGGLNGTNGNPAPNVTGGGGGVTSGYLSGSGGAAGRHSGRGCQGFAGSFLQGAPTCYSNSGGGGGYFGGGSGGSNFDSNTGGGGGGGSGFILTSPVPAQLQNAQSPSYSTGANAGQPRRVTVVINGSPTTYTNDTTVTIP